MYVDLELWPSRTRCDPTRVYLDRGQREQRDEYYETFVASRSERENRQKTLGISNAMYRRGCYTQLQTVAGSKSLPNRRSSYTRTLLRTRRRSQGRECDDSAMIVKPSRFRGRLQPWLYWCGDLYKYKFK